MMHYYAQHTATRNWFASVLRIDEVEQARLAGVQCTETPVLLMTKGFDMWAADVAQIVGVALHRAAHHTTTGRGRS